MRGVGSRGLAAGSQAGSSYRLDPDPTYHHPSIPQRKLMIIGEAVIRMRNSKVFEECPQQFHTTYYSESPEIIK
ncbi:unnamed protein product [Sphagnum jensenii]|uniref:NADH-plastoquinone oxidoreductase subunit K n=1 Tax=Sphagnum jensenii TaxID=128206 RepID=A0ABP1BPM1_9BRYO